MILYNQGGQESFTVSFTFSVQHVLPPNVAAAGKQLASWIGASLQGWALSWSTAHSTMHTTVSVYYTGERWDVPSRMCLGAHLGDAVSIYFIEFLPITLLLEETNR